MGGGTSPSISMRRKWYSVPNVKLTATLALLPFGSAVKASPRLGSVSGNPLMVMATWDS